MHEPPHYQSLASHASDEIAMSYVDELLVFQQYLINNYMYKLTDIKHFASMVFILLVFYYSVLDCLF